MSIAVLIALGLLGVASFTNSLGLILMKMSIIANEDMSGISYIRNKKYISGLLCLVFGAVVLVGKGPPYLITNIVTLSIADMITVSSVSSLTLVFNCILSSRLLGEKLTKFDLVSSVLISVGAMICVAFSSLE